MAPPLGRLGGRPFERRLSAEPTTAVARRDVAELLEPPLGLVPCERHPVAEQTFVIFVLKQDVLQGVPVVVRSRGREIGLQVGDEFMFVVVEPLGILDRQVEGDLLGRARRCGIPPDLEIRVEVVEGAGIAAQEPLVLVSDEGSTAPNGPGAPSRLILVR